MKDIYKMLMPGEIIKKYPVVRQVQWTANDIGVLYKMRLVDGFRRCGRTYVHPDDVLRLLYFRFPSLR